MTKFDWFEFKYDLYKKWRHSFLGEAVWWVKYRVLPWHQYHLIKTRLKPGYYDADVRMEVGLVQMIIDFVEIEFFQFSQAIEVTATRITPLEQLHAHVGWLKKELSDEDNESSKSCLSQSIQKYEELIELYVWCSRNIKKVRYEEDQYSDYEFLNYDFVRDSENRFQEELETRLIQIVKFRKNLWS